MPHHKSYVSKFIKIFVVSFVVLLSTILLLGSLKSANAACYCVSPEVDGCACTTTGGSISTSEGAVALTCDTEEDAASTFVRVNPICGSSVEIQPWCAYHADAPWELTCYGTGFTDNDGSLPSNFTGWFTPEGSPNATISFNGFTSSATIAQVYVCHDNLFCCGGGDRCSEDGVPELPDSCESPLNSVPPSEEVLAVCNGVFPGLVSEGESRLWFSNTRMVSALATMAQTLFNPQDLNFLYDTTAFSKNAPPSDRSGGIDNLGSITTRVERHQGADDYTVVVNTTDNNSSVVTGHGAPIPLSPYYEDYRDLACYIPEKRNNPGDDLLGAKITAEMLFTHAFTYEAKGRPAGCTDDDDDYTVPYGDDVDCTQSIDSDENICCSGGCSVDTWGGHGCTQVVDFASCGVDLPDLPHSCSSGGNIYCCSDAGECVPQPTEVTCNSLEPIDLPVGADANIYNKTPLIEYLLETLLRGDDSLYRRFLPELDQLTEDDEYEFEDIPSSSSFGAGATPNDYGTYAGGFDLEYADGQAPAPEMYFPFVGTLDEYWLQSFQTALRPQGYDRTTSGIDLPPDEPIPPGPVPPITSCSNSPEPYSPELDAMIGAAIARYGANSATALVPAGALRAIYFIESFGQWNNPNYDCSFNSLGPTVGILGLMQIGNTAYNLTVPLSQRIADEHQCADRPGVMSRCNPIDAIEIAARVLLYKVGLWDFGNFRPTGAIRTAAQVYCSSAGYYGSTIPDTATDARARDRNVPAGVSTACRNEPTLTCDTNYSEVVTYDAGLYTSASQYPNPRPPAGACLSNY